PSCHRTRDFPSPGEYLGPVPALCRHDQGGSRHGSTLRPYLSPGGSTMEIRTATRARGLGELPPLSGAHILHFYTSEAERREALQDFIQCGTDRGERTLCITEKPTDEMLQEFLQGQDPEDGRF